jgi:hypothetical protein
MCLNLHSISEQQFGGRLSDSIRVVQRFLVPFVLVRIQVGQQFFSDCEQKRNPIFFNQH